MLLGHHVAVQLAERRFSVEQCVRVIEFDDPATVEHGNSVEIEDGVELVGDGDDGVGGEFFADQALHYFVCFGVDAVE